ncbi:MAG: hypothetical protein QM784_39005 [Polyangiaceae bacterium]
MSSANIDLTRVTATIVSSVVQECTGTKLALREYPACPTDWQDQISLVSTVSPFPYSVGSISRIGTHERGYVVRSTDRGQQICMIQLDSPSNVQSFALAVAESVKAQSSTNDCRAHSLAAAFRCLDALTDGVCYEDGTWRSEILPMAEGSEDGGGAYVEITGSAQTSWSHFLEFRETSTGVRVSCPDVVASAPPRVTMLTTIYELEQAIPTVIERARDALRGRNSFRGRPFSLHSVVPNLLSMLKKEAGAGQLQYTEETPTFAYPSCQISRASHGNVRTWVTCSESREGVSIESRSHKTLVASIEDYNAKVPLLLAAVRAELANEGAVSSKPTHQPTKVPVSRDPQVPLTAKSLEPGRQYEVLTPIVHRDKVYPAGTMLVFTRASYCYRENYTDYYFSVLGTTREELLLTEDYCPPDIELLKTIAQWLRPC